MSKSDLLTVRFLRAFPGGPVPFDERLLDSPIPVANPALHGRDASVTYRDYLQAIRSFAVNSLKELQELVRECGLMESIAGLDIISEKHGSDYHPARLVVRSENSAVSFVVNVAVSDRGRSRLQHEFDVLRRLHRERHSEFIPRAYIMGEQPVSGQSSHPPIKLFLGQWFEGYHELHLSKADNEGHMTTVLWDMDREYKLLKPSEADQVVRRAAEILTFFYNVETFEEIFPWHHAAGDFVAERSQKGMDVKLITVRQYAPRIFFDTEEPESGLTAILLFLANMTLRMRLDRLDGVGPVVWAGPDAVKATIAGFFDGLELTAERGWTPTNLPKDMRLVLAKLTPADLGKLFRDLVEGYEPDAPDVPVIQENLVEHILQVYRDLQAIGSENS